ncbi:carbohydrate ABC transporter permease [Paenibacillus solisilvae]|uniref:Carbohydrate ABC transporter permease n=1 Tax=Paenibacillus solisilvae TaxID=2486751 RepID=A0ABW0VSA6_9BACL
MAEIRNTVGLETVHPKGSLKRKRFTPYVFISPFFIIFAIFGLFPILFTFVLSFADWDGLKPIDWVGIHNYVSLFSDPTFVLSLKNTVILILFTLPTQILLALVLAFILHIGLVRRRDLFQTLLFLPYITTPIAIGMLFSAIFDWKYGLLNAILLKMHLISEAIPWLQTAMYSKPLLAAILDWKYTGYTMVLLMAGMKTIPKDIYESAAIDGATVFDSFWRITLPLLKNILTFVVITSIVGGFQIFEEPLLLYSSGASGDQGFGGPDQSAMTIVMYLYQSAYKFYRWGYAAAIGYVLAIIILGCSLLSMKLMSRRG